MPYRLVLLRHGESDWNQKNLFTGWVDVDLTEKGRAEAVRGGPLMAGAGLLPHRRHPRPRDRRRGPPATNTATSSSWCGAAASTPRRLRSSPAASSTRPVTRATPVST